MPAGWLLFHLDGIVSRLLRPDPGPWRLALLDEAMQPNTARGDDHARGGSFAWCSEFVPHGCGARSSVKEGVHVSDKGLIANVTALIYSIYLLDSLDSCGQFD